MIFIRLWNSSTTKALLSPAFPRGSLIGRFGRQGADLICNTYLHLSSGGRRRSITQRQTQANKKAAEEAREKARQKATEQAQAAPAEETVQEIIKETIKKEFSAKFDNLGLKNVRSEILRELSRSPPRRQQQQQQ